MKVSVSFLNSKNIPRDLTLLNDTDVDFIHVDVMDGKFVKGKTMPFSEMRHISSYTSKRLDVHLMVNNPSRYIPLYAELNCEYITIHEECSDDITKDLEMIRGYSIKSGIAISPDTKISKLIPYLPYVDLILVMSVHPGKGGQEFITDTEERIHEVRDLINSYNLDIKINVDGGINDDTSLMCREADILTSGSYIIKSDNFQDKISSLR